MAMYPSPSADDIELPDPPSGYDRWTEVPMDVWFAAARGKTAPTAYVEITSLDGGEFQFHFTATKDF